MNIEQNNTISEEENSIDGPGKLLAQARENLGLSVEDVAKKLNFRVALVNDIDADIFDASLPKTFNRGYLTNYARLVGLAPQDILQKFEQLTGENTKQTVMQSFSRNTEKQAESNIIMWVSYGIIALLVASTVMWWLQDINTESESTTETQVEKVKNADEAPVSQFENTNEDGEDIDPTSFHMESDYADQNNEILAEEANGNINTLSTTDSSASQSESQIMKVTAVTTDNEIPTPEETQPSHLTRAVFTFSGDCWVNIYDGNDERIAWGIKKAGYIMELNAVPPIKVTVGKPELVAITVNGIDVDLSAHSVGNIAKFTLPKS